MTQLMHLSFFRAKGSKEFEYFSKPRWKGRPEFLFYSTIWTHWVLPTPISPRNLTLGPALFNFTDFFFYGKVEKQYHKIKISITEENFFYCFMEKWLWRKLLRTFSTACLRSKRPLHSSLNGFLGKPCFSCFDRY